MKPRTASLRRAVWLLAGTAVLLPTVAQATDGYFSTAFGIRSRGLAGASIALPLDSLAAANNPAGLVWVDRRWDGSLLVFNPRRRYSIDGSPTGPGSFFPGTVYSGEDFFLMPTFGMNFPQHDGSSIGVALYGNGGMNTTWPGDANGGYGTFGSGPAGVNLEQAFLAGTYSRKFNEMSSWGVSLVYVLQRFSAKGLQGFNPSSDSISNNGIDTSQGVGVRLGVQSEVRPGVTVGATYMPKIKMEKFSKYSDLFADHGNFDIPENFGVGVAYKPNDKSVVAFDIKRINYSNVPSVGNPGSNMAPLGDPNGPGFGWDDETVYKLGYQWEAKPGLTWRLGLSYGTEPIRGSDVMFNILAPGVQEWHFTTGFTKQLNENSEFSMALVYSPRKTIYGPNPNDPTQTIGLSMYQYELEFGYSKRF